MRRARSAIVCVTLLPFGGGAIAQSPAPSGAQFGVLAGVGSAFIGRGNTVLNSGDRTSGTGGVFAVIPVLRLAAIQPELIVANKGTTSGSCWVADDNSLGCGASDGHDFSMNYLEVPVLLRVGAPASIHGSPFVVIGPALSFRVACRFGQADNIEPHHSYSCGDIERHASDAFHFNRVDAGAVIGAGFAVAIGDGTASFGGRLDSSLRPVVSDHDVKHRVVSFLASYAMPVRRSR